MRQIIAWQPFAVALLLCQVISSSLSADQKPTVGEAKAPYVDQLKNTPLTVDFLDTPIDEAARVIFKQLKIPVRIDERGLNMYGLNADVYVTARFTNVSGETLLRLILAEHDFTYRIDTFGIEITSFENAEWLTGPAKFYPVEDLLALDENRFLDMGLQQSILTNVWIDTWEVLGGYGTLQLYAEGLVVLQTDPVHRKVKDLLTSLRKAKRRRDDNADNRFDPLWVTVDPEASERVLSQLKEMKIDLTFDETPLSEISRRLHEATQLNFALEMRELDDHGLRANSVVSGDWKEATPERILHDITHPLDLTWRLDDNVVVISTREMAEQELMVRVYPVHDLIAETLESPAERLNAWHIDADWAGRSPTQDAAKLVSSADYQRRVYRELQEVLKGGVRPESWEDLGAAGTSAAVPNVGCLVIAQNLPEHQKIESLLAEMRAGLKARGTDRPEEADDPVASPLVVRQYVLTPPQQDRPIPHRDLKRLARRIELAVEPESWNHESTFVDVYENRLVICQREDLHRRIEQLIQASGFSEPNYPGAPLKPDNDPPIQLLQFGSPSMTPPVGER